MALWECAERVAAAVQSRLPPQLAHLVEHPGRDSLKSLPTLQRHMPALAAQAGSTSELHLAEFSLSSEAPLSLHLPQARRPSHVQAEGKDPQVHLPMHFGVQRSS